MHDALSTFLNPEKRKERKKPGKSLVHSTNAYYIQSILLNLAINNVQK
jgi:hypothetical protein